MEKIARICWNTHDWKRPSGSEQPRKQISDLPLDEDEDEDNVEQD